SSTCRSTAKMLLHNIFGVKARQPLRVAHALVRAASPLLATPGCQRRRCREARLRVLRKSRHGTHEWCATGYFKCGTSFSFSLQMYSLTSSPGARSQPTRIFQGLVNVPGSSMVTSFSRRPLLG